MGGGRKAALHLLFFVQGPSRTRPLDHPVLALLEAAWPEFQRPAVFAHGPDDVVRGTVWQLCFDLDGHPHPGVWEASQVLDDLVGHVGRVTDQPHRIGRHAAVESPQDDWHGRLGWERWLEDGWLRT